MNEGNNSNNYDRNSPGNKTSNDKKSSLIKRIIVLCITLVVILVISTYILKTLVPIEYIILLHIAEASIIGYFVIEIVSNAVYERTVNYFRNAESIRILIRIIGALIVIAIIVSYLSQNPIIATSIGTIAAIVVGFASQNIIGNIIAGLYLAVSRPFKIGDKITVFGYTGIIYDIGLLNSKLSDKNSNIILVPNLAMVSATIILQKE